MLEPCGRLSFTGESDANLFAEREVGWEYLDRHPALQLEVAGAIDDAHAAAADFPFDLVRTGEDVGQPGG